MTVGERIYYCRIENHMTQKELGEKTGIDGATIGKYERGVLNPKIGTLQKIANALGIEWDTLYTLDKLRTEEQKLKEESQKVEVKRAQLAQLEVKRAQLEKEAAAQKALIAVSKSFGAGGRKLMESYSQLNDNGQRVAVERVQELAQIPAYQRSTDPAQSAAGPAADDSDTKE